MSDNASDSPNSYPLEMLSTLSERVERECLAEVQAVLARYRCELRARPAPVDKHGQIWGYQWGVFYEGTTP